jgi:micrococcal nuclease
MWTYRARLDRVIDGDTVDMDIDLGFRHVIERHRLRLAGLNTPEVRGEEREAGLAAKQFVVDWFYDHRFDAVEWAFIVRAEKAGKYGRWLGWIWPVDEFYEGTGPSLNKALIEAGHAELLDY